MFMNVQAMWSMAGGSIKGVAIFGSGYQVCNFFDICCHLFYFVEVCTIWCMLTNL